MPIEAIYSPTPSKLFLAILWSEKFGKLKEIIDFMDSSFLENFDCRCQKSFTPLYFPMRNYYEKEMGGELKRVFLLMTNKFERSQYVAIKKFTISLEKETACDQKRRLNIDPGLLSLEQALLISTKPYSHRIYLQDNLYAELLYEFKNKQYQSLPWTYPDYKAGEVIDLFTSWRNEELIAEG